MLRLSLRRPVPRMLSHVAAQVAPARAGKEKRIAFEMILILMLLAIIGCIMTGISLTRPSRP